MAQRQRARNLRKNSTDAESALWNLLRDRRLSGHKFRRQIPVGKHIVDFVCYQTRLVIELDGGQHQEQKQYDDARTAWLESEGFAVLRFWNNDVLTNPNGVLDKIVSVLDNGIHPHPCPLPSREGEQSPRGSP